LAAVGVISNQGHPKMKWILPGLLALMVAPSVSLAEAPVFAVAPAGSAITFRINASIRLQGRFHKWTSSLTFTTPDVSTAVLDIKIDANSVDAGSGTKNNALKGRTVFDVKNYPVIGFHSTKIYQTGPSTFAALGDFTVRGISKPQTLVLKVTGQGGSSGEIKGTMAFSRKSYGITASVPFVRIGDQVDLTVDLKVQRTGGPPITLKP
jgi:polyisoprenoid-binding protein YceI